MSASPAYALRAECRGHEDDVRGVAVVAPDAFATCSRDKTVRVWREAIGDDGYATAAVCVGHTSFVTALARVPADAHRAWGERFAPHVVDGSPAWHVYRPVPVLRAPAAEEEASAAFSVGGGGWGGG